MSKFKINKKAGYELFSGERVGWLDRFADNYEKQKSAVEVARERSQRSLYDQISSIVSGSSARHASVESKVQDLQERVGLTEYLKRISSEREENTKTAAGEFADTLENVDDELKERIATFCKNKIETYRGHISVPAIQEEIIVTFKIQGVQPQDINDPQVATVINAMIKEEQDRNPESGTISDKNLGLGVGVELDDDEGANSDFFAPFMPNKD